MPKSPQSSLPKPERTRKADNGATDQPVSSGELEGGAPSVDALRPFARALIAAAIEMHGELPHRATPWPLRQPNQAVAGQWPAAVQHPAACRGPVASALAGTTRKAYVAHVIAAPPGGRMAWMIVVVEPARSWLHQLRRTDRATLLLISQAIEALSMEGPALGRPLVDTIKGSRLANLKELRPGSARSERGTATVRVRSATTSRDLGGWGQGRQLATVVQGGDPAAEAAYEEHLERSKKGGTR